MACNIADNQPLKKLRIDLDLVETCHSTRADCFHGLERGDELGLFGIPGAALGYCQALFNRQGTAEAHTIRVRSILERIGAPWASSHELFLGHQGEDDVSSFVEGGTRPLCGSGRVPILITGLDASSDEAELAGVFATRPNMFVGETALVRVVLNSEEAMGAAASLVSKLLRVARESGEMPVWWPLLQGARPIHDWRRLEERLGGDWKYVNIAVNPFTPNEILDKYRDQVTVAQIPVGHPVGVSGDGTIELPEEMGISGQGSLRGYDLLEYVSNLVALEINPTLIVLGPALADWSEATNAARIERLLQPLRTACNTLWRDLSEARKEMIWCLAA